MSEANSKQLAALDYFVHGSAYVVYQAGDRRCQYCDDQITKIA